MLCHYADHGTSFYSNLLCYNHTHHRFSLLSIRNPYVVLPLSIILLLTIWFLAYSNGANDNFKGVATLFGSDTLNYKKAIWWATGTTFAGSIASIFFASALVKNFSGKGLVPDIVASSPEFLTAVGIGAGLTVFLATLTGFPISTTHSLTGALTGTGITAVGIASQCSCAR